MIITIIVLLILAGVTIAAITGNENAMSKAQKAKSDTDIAEAKEAAALSATGHIADYMDKKYVKNDSSVANKTKGEYVAEQMDGETSGSFVFATEGLALTVAKSGTTIVTGTIDTDGNITWNATPDESENGGGGQTGGTSTVKELAQSGAIKVGDYVNYTPSSGNVTVTATQTGADNDQTFSTASNSGMTWRVLSVDSTTGEVKIVGTPTTQQLTLKGKAGFGNAETVLNNIAGIFGGGTGAASVRSITEDDIFDSIGYNKTTNYVGDTNTYTSGEWFTENWDSTSGTSTYSTTTTTATAENPVTLHKTSHNQYDSNSNWVGGGINIASQTLENGTAAQKAAMQIYWDMLIGGDYEDVANYDYTGCLNYWCASRLVNCYSDDAVFCVRNVYDGGINSGNGALFYSHTSGDTNEISYSRAVVPVVTLQSNIGMEQDNNNVWNFVSNT